MVVFGGGRDDSDSWSVLNDTWALNLNGGPEWKLLHAGEWPPVDVPTARAFHSTILDRRGNRMILVGGSVPGPFARGPYGDLWEFRFDDLCWARIASPGESYPLWRWPAAILDERRDRGVVFEEDALWSIDLAVFRRRPEPSAMIDGDFAPGATDGGSVRLSVVSPNPFVDEIVLDATLPASRGPVRVDLFDVAGRRLAGEGIEPLAGTQRVRMSGLKELRSGIYLLRLNAPEGARSVRLVHVR